jgi:hypothetical protein
MTMISTRPNVTLGGVPVQDPLQSLRELARVLTVILPVAAAAGLFRSYAKLRRADLVEGVLAGRAHDQAAADAADSLVRLAGLVHILVIIPLVVMFMLWAMLLAKNAAVLGSTTAPTPRRVVGSWFVPVANLWLPALHLIRADRQSGSLVDRDSAASRRMIIRWAIVFGTSLTAAVLLWRSVPRNLMTIVDVEAYAQADRYDLVPQSGFAIAAVLAVVMVRRLTERQGLAFHDRFEAGRDADGSSDSQTVPGVPGAR